VFACVDGFYPDSAAKIALVIAVGQSAKTHLVEEFGVGEEMAMNLFGWVDDRFTCLAQMDLNWGDPKDQEERLNRIFQTAVVMRRGWGVDSFTLLAEGWVSTKPDQTRDRDLVDDFVENEKSPVRECLSVLHVEDEGENIDICAQPFHMRPGKSVDFGTLMHAEGAEMLRNPEHLEVLENALRFHEPAEVPQHELAQFRLALTMGLADESGFFLQDEF
jgi:hypothetical protein